ncbi:UTP--glucose-1-phosphate uridylyltransferase [bacterium HR33]|nr:UTP--glucose-1-phosphate uridylyltransferase [bacterium HR33]
MKVILPLAGKGTRLLPLTNYVPKPLVRVAGRPVMDWVMDNLEGLDVEELIFITGHLKEQVEEYARRNYHKPMRFIEQKVQDGTAGAVGLAEPYVNGPVLIVFVDTLFRADLSLARTTDADGIIWASEVEDYRRFGVVVTDEAGYMLRIVEKPSEPISRLANIGVYYIRDWKTLFEGIRWAKERPPLKGEWFLTDAFQYMIDQGRRLYTARATDWYDCGKLETLLETNFHLLKSGHSRRPPDQSGVTIVDPVHVAEGAQLSDCTIGPNVTIESGAEISGSVLAHTLVGRGARVKNSRLVRCLVGDGTTLEGQDLEGFIAAGNELAPAP